MQLAYLLGQLLGAKALTIYQSDAVATFNTKRPLTSFLIILTSPPYNPHRTSTTSAKNDILMNRFSSTGANVKLFSHASPTNLMNHAAEISPQNLSNPTRDKTRGQRSGLAVEDEDKINDQSKARSFAFGAVVIATWQQRRCRGAREKGCSTCATEVHDENQMPSK